MATGVMAQQPKQGTFSIILHIGVSLANLPGDDIYVDGNMPFSSRYKAGFAGGVDLDYQALPNLSVSIGAYYSQQGCNYRNSSVETDAEGNIVINGVGYSNWSTQLDYINVPLMLNAYIAPGVAVKAGVQMGFALSGKMKYTEMRYSQNKDGEYNYETPEDKEVKLGDGLKNMTVAIPVGLSYEFSNVILDARYNIGLTKVQKIYESPKNRVFMFSAAYRFAL